MVLLPKVPPDPAVVSRLAGAVAFTDYACVSAMRTVLPYYAAKLPGALSGGAGVGALESVYGLGQAAGAVVLGRASDVWGRRAVLLLHAPRAPRRAEQQQHQRHALRVAALEQHDAEQSEIADHQGGDRA